MLALSILSAVVIAVVQGWSLLPSVAFGIACYAVGRLQHD